MIVGQKTLVKLNGCFLYELVTGNLSVELSIGIDRNIADNGTYSYAGNMKTLFGIYTKTLCSEESAERLCYLAKI